MHDLVIRGGTVIDGSGTPGRQADVAVRDGQIVEVGRVLERGAEEIDADEHVVTPGFIDLHTHMDAQVFWDPVGTCSSYHGVTTVLMGNCGFTLAPSRRGREELALRSIERAEDISSEAVTSNVDWTWQTFAEYLDAVDLVPKGINYAALVGHSALRSWAMDEQAFECPASDDQLISMERALEDALRAGAWGFSTSRSDTHTTTAGTPVASRQATWEEVRRLVATMGSLGPGLFEIAPDSAVRAPDDDVRRDALRRLAAIAVETRVPTTFGIVPNQHAWREHLQLLDFTVAAGGRMFGLSHSRGVAQVLSFQTRLPFDQLPAWQTLRTLPDVDQQRALSDPATKALLVRDAHEGPYPVGVAGFFRKPDFARLQVLIDAVGPNPSVATLAAARGQDPVELMIDLAVESEFRQCFVAPLTSTSTEDLYEVMSHPRCVMTFSDSGAHVGQIIDSSIHTHLLAYWVRERQAFTLERAVQMITSIPARAAAIPDRGIVAEGAAADLNVFDPDSIAPALPRVAFDVPAGGARLDQRAIGIRATIVAGEVVLTDGEPSGATPGVLLRRRY